MLRNRLFSRIAFAPDGAGAGAGGGAPAGGEGGGAPAGGAPGGEGGAGAATGDWRASLPEPLKAHAGLQKFKDPGALATSYIELEKAFGSDKIVLPGKDAKPEEWDPIFEKLGRPKDPTGYQFPEVKDRPYTEGDKALQGAFAPIAHKLGLSQAQVAGIVEFQTGLAVKGIEAATKGAADAEAALRKEHGDGYDAYLEGANKALHMVLASAKIPVDQFRQIKLADGTFLGDNPLMVKLYGAIGATIGETAFQGGSGGGGGSFGAFATPAAAKAELDRLYGTDFRDEKHPYNDKRNPQHKAWSDRVMRLQDVASKA